MHHHLVILAWQQGKKAAQANNRAKAREIRTENRLAIMGVILTVLVIAVSGMTIRFDIALIFPLTTMEYGNLYYILSFFNIYGAYLLFNCNPFFLLFFRLVILPIFENFITVRHCGASTFK